MAPFRDRISWYLGLSAYWYATSYKWFILLLVIVPAQVKEIVPGGEKGASWGMVFAIGAAWAMVGPSIFGYLSDHMPTRWGRRRPWLAIGSSLTVVALVFLMNARELWVITIGYLLLQVADDVGTGPYSALIPELVPVEHRGRASGMMGLLTLLGQFSVGILALVVGGDVKTIYISIAVVNILGAVIAMRTITGAEKTLSEARDKSVSIAGFFQGWLEPWKHRDFFWVWFTRLLNAFGFYLVVTYVQYFLGDRIGSYALGPITFPNAGMATNALALLISMVGAISSISAAKLADQIGRKKTIYIAGTCMAIVMVPFAFASSFALVFLLAFVFGSGYGMYLSADWALVSDVLPSEESAGKDMGIWQMSNSAVQVLTGAAGALVDAGNRWGPGRGYTVAFLLAAVSFFASTYLVRQVKGST